MYLLTFMPLWYISKLFLFHQKDIRIIVTYIYSFVTYKFIYKFIKIKKFVVKGISPK